MEFNTLGYESQTLVLGGFGCHSLRSKHMGCLIQMEIQHAKVLGIGCWVLGIGYWVGSVLIHLGPNTWVSDTKWNSTHQGV